MTVAEVVARARVSRRTFYDVFTDREDCLLAAFELALSRARLTACEAYERESGWREGIRAALASLLILMDEEPGYATLCVLEAPGAGEPILQRRAAMLDQLAGLLDQGRAVTSAGREPPQLTAEGIVGGIFAVLQTRMTREAREPLTDLLGPLMSMIVLPYLGATAASRELSRPGPEIPRERHARRQAGSTDPLEGLDMRLTHRTARVLTVIAEHPRASNREIAEGSGIVDQGQISKLLTRLARLGLIENFGEGQEMGGPNAWRLTARGAQVERAVHPR